MSAPVAASSPAHLPGFLHTVAPLLDNFGYAAVAVVLFLENGGLPVPGETILVAAAVYAGAGRLNVVAVGLTGFVASTVGCAVGFAIGKRFGRQLAVRFGRYVRLTEERLARAEGFLDRHAGLIIVVARFLEGLRQLLGLVAGSTDLGWRPFLLYNTLGAALWVAAWTTIGYEAGGHVNAIYHGVTRYQLYVLGGLGAIILLLTVRLWLRRRRRSSR